MTLSDFWVMLKLIPYFGNLLQQEYVTMVKLAEINVILLSVAQILPSHTYIALKKNIAK